MFESYVFSLKTDLKAKKSCLQKILKEVTHHSGHACLSMWFISVPFVSVKMILLWEVEKCIMEGH